MSIYRLYLSKSFEPHLFLSKKLSVLENVIININFVVVVIITYLQVTATAKVFHKAAQRHILQAAYIGTDSAESNRKSSNLHALLNIKLSQLQALSKKE